MLYRQLFVFTTILSIGVAYSSVAISQQPDVAEASEDGVVVLEEVIVTGIRRSLENALNGKRGSDQIVDGISSELLGKFPDDNVAESLQRVTGVSVSREGGEGSRVSVRGLSPDLTKVTVNGQSVSTASGGRDFDFRTIASEVVSAVEVVKTPTADMDEGGVGATVNIKTPMPLEIGDRKFIASVKGSYEELSGETSPRASILFSDVYGDDDQFGFLANVSYSERAIRIDSLNGSWERRPISDFDPSLGLTEEPFTPRNFQPRLSLEDRDRLNVNSTLQWRPTDSISTFLSGTFTKLETSELSYRMPARLFRTRTRGGVFAFEDVVLDGDTVVSSTLNDPGIRLRSSIDNNVTDTYIVATGIEWTNDVWTMSAVANFTEAKREQEEFQVAFEDRYGVNFNVNEGASNPESVVLQPIVDVADHSQFSFDRYQGNPVDIEDKESSIQADFERAFDSSFTAVKFGLKYKERDNAVNTTRSQIRRLDIAFEDFAVPFPVDDFLSGFGGVPSTLASGDVRALENEVAALNGGITYGFRPLESGTVVEDSLAAYVMANFEGSVGSVPVRGNFGVRYVETETTSSGFQTDDPDDQNATPVTVDADYSDTLPSINVSFDLTDDLILRLAAAGVMSRPTLSDIRLSQTINEARLEAFLSNPSLDPFRADQFDASLEWYFDDAALLSFAIFRKDIESFITEVTTDNVDLGLDVTSPGAPGVPDGINDLFQVTQVVNGDGAVVNGVELAYQQNFTFFPQPWDGFGAVLNYTYADSESNFIDQVTGAALPLPGHSENTYNVILFYETDRFGARVSYNYRDDYLLTPVGTGGLPEFVQSLGQVDFGASFGITDKWTATFDVTNLNNETVINYYGEEVRFGGYEETGTRYFLGIRYSY